MLLAIIHRLVALLIRANIADILTPHASEEARGVNLDLLQ